MKIRRKSWAVNRRGCPVAGSGRPVRARASSSRSRRTCRRGDVVLGADPALEQQRRGWEPDQFVAVAGPHQRNGPVWAADAADDGAEHVGQFGADHEQPFGVGLGRRDLQQRHEFAGAGQPVLNEAVVAEFEQFLDPDAGVAQHFDDRPGPEGVLFVPVEQLECAGVGVGDPHVVRAAVRPVDPGEGGAGGGERLSGRGLLAGAEQGLSVAAPAVGGFGRARAAPAAGRGCGCPCAPCGGAQTCAGRGRPG